MEPQENEEKETAKEYCVYYELETSLRLSNESTQLKSPETYHTEQQPRRWEWIQEQRRGSREWWQFGGIHWFEWRNRQQETVYKWVAVSGSTQRFTSTIKYDIWRTTKEVHKRQKRLTKSLQTLTWTKINIDRKSNAHRHGLIKFLGGGETKHLKRIQEIET